MEKIQVDEVVKAVESARALQELRSEEPWMECAVSYVKH